MAAASPEGPPPTTSTSLRATTWAEPGTSSMRSIIGLLLMCGRRLPAHDHPLGERNHEEERDREYRADDHGRIEHGRVEVVHRLDDQRADAVGRADPFADDGADHCGRGGDLQRGEE